MDDTGAILLCGAIIRQAYKEYIDMLKKAAKKGEDPSVTYDFVATEKFLKSGFVVTGMGIDGDYLIRKAKEEAYGSR